MEIKAAMNDILYETAQDGILVLVRDAADVCRKVRLPVVQVLGIENEYIFDRSCRSKWCEGLLCMYGHAYSKSIDQPGKVASPACGQLNRENEYFLVSVHA